jgi:transcription antitermination factor NusG
MNDDLWYALQVRPRSEWMVEANLRNKGYTPFLPTYKSKRRWSDRIKTLDVPLFPGYLFCQFDVRTRLPILKTPGVSHIVGIGKNPEPIDLVEIEAIRRVVKSGVVYEPHPYVTVGQFVQVEQGSLCGLTGLVTDLRHDSRLIISVNLLMRSVSVEIDRAWVKPIGNPPAQRFLAPVVAGMKR